MTDAPDSKGSVLFDFADQLLGDLEAGRDLPLAHYLARFPGHEEHVAREYLLLTGKVGAEGERVATRMHPRDRIGPYRLQEVLGRGGQGIVYRAVDSRFDRTVALKVLSLPVSSVSQGRRNRFRREAEILSRLDHPGVCTVLDADLDSETPYIAMRFVEGETLAAALGRARDARLEAREADETPASDASTSASRLLAPRRALELAETLSFFERAARALHAAHEAGVVHRDVKPGNIMVTKEGLPVLLDFGLARGDQEESLSLTRADEVFGTPAYLSPEQARSGRDVDRRTDIYSLGVVLYECLTLDRPTRADSSGSSTSTAHAPAGTTVRDLNPSLPSDLAVVLETAMERDVQRRYPTALELAEELRRVREYEPIRARPAGVLLRMRRWSQRNPVVATAVIGSLVALSSALVISLVLLRRVNDEKTQKEIALALFEGGWYRDQASSFIASSPPRALRSAIIAAEKDPGLASNRVLLSALDANFLRQVLVGHAGMVTQVDIDRSSTLLASTSVDGTVRIWNLQTGAEVGTLSPGRGRLFAVRFSPDATRVALGGQGGFCRIEPMSAAAGPAVDLAGPMGDVLSIDFSPDGGRVVVGSRDSSVRVFDAASGGELGRFTGHTGNVSEVRFCDEGRLIVSRSAEPPESGLASESDHTARVFDTQAWTERCVLAGHSDAIVAVAIDPGARRVVTVSEDCTARQWRLDTREHDPAPERVFDAPGKFHDASFSPNGKQLALCWDAGAKVVDTATGKTVYALPDHGHRAIPRIAFSPDGSALATISYDDTLRVFRADDGLLLHSARSNSRRMQGLRWAPDGESIVTWTRNTAIDVWYGRERPYLQVLKGHTGSVRSARFSAGGDLVVTASSDGTARSWDVRTAGTRGVFDPAAFQRARVPLLGARLDRTAERIATTDESAEVVVWRTRDDSALAWFAGEGGAALCAELSADGRRLAMSCRPGGVALVELDSGRIRRLRAHDGTLTTIRFTPDGTRLVTGGDDRSVCLWDARFDADAPPESETAEPIWRTQPFDPRIFRLKRVFDAQMSPDGRWVVAACESQDLQIYDARDGRTLDSKLVATPGHICFDHDLPVLMAGSKYGGAATWWRIAENDGGVQLVSSPQQDVAGVYHQNGLTSLVAASGAHRAVTTSLDRSARLWDLEKYQCLVEYAAHTDAVLDSDIDAAGSTLVTASADGTARLWPCDVLETARRFEPESSPRIFGTQRDLLRLETR